MDVLILPMRNGNFLHPLFHLFLQHLRSYPTYEEWKHLDFKVSNDNQLIYVLILPMRNGNLFYFLSFFYLLFCSYPTYEEWKHASGHIIKV